MYIASRVSEWPGSITLCAHLTGRINEPRIVISNCSFDVTYSTSPVNIAINRIFSGRHRMRELFTEYP